MSSQNSYKSHAMRQTERDEVFIVSMLVEKSEDAFLNCTILRQYVVAETLSGNGMGSIVYGRCHEGSVAISESMA